MEKRVAGVGSRRGCAENVDRNGFTPYNRKIMEIDGVATFSNLPHCIALILFMPPSCIKQSCGSESYAPLELDINQVSVLQNF